MVECSRKPLASLKRVIISIAALWCIIFISRAVKWSGIRSAEPDVPSTGAAQSPSPPRTALFSRGFQVLFALPPALASPDMPPFASASPGPAAAAAAAAVANASATAVGARPGSTPTPVRATDPVDSDNCASVSRAPDRCAFAVAECDDYSNLLDYVRVRYCWFPSGGTDSDAFTSTHVHAHTHAYARTHAVSAAPPSALLGPPPPPSSPPVQLQAQVQVQVLPAAVDLRRWLS